MESSGTPPTQYGSTDAAMLVRSPTIITIVVGVIATVVGGVLAGGKGVLAGALATIVVVGFFAGGQIIVGRVLRTNPAIALNTALLVYVVQIGVLFALLALLKDATFFAPKVFAFTVLVCALTWILVAVIGFARNKPLYVEPGTGPGAAPTAQADPGPGTSRD